MKINTTYNASAKDLRQKIESIRRDLTLDKQNLSATKRKKTSVMDDRLSAQMTGVTGVCLMVLLYGLLVVLDLRRLKIALLGIEDNEEGNERAFRFRFKSVLRKK
nr:hypothetical protein BaRGS_014435 [Batillaria attramentaria]